MIEYDEYKQKLTALGPELEKLAAALDIDTAKREAASLEAQTSEPEFWNNLERSQQVQQHLKRLQGKIGRQEKMVSNWEDLKTLCEMGKEEDDPSLLDELKEGYAKLEEEISEQRLSTLLSGEYDNNNAILSFHVAVGKVQNDYVVGTRFNALHALLADLAGAHLRLEVVGCHLRRGHQHTILAGENSLRPTVEEKGHMGSRMHRS